jgi:hypothetical protein
MSWEYARTVVLVPTLLSMLYRAVRTLKASEERHACRPQDPPYRQSPPLFE